MFSQSLPIVFLEAIAQRMDFSQVAILQTVPGAHVFLGRLGNCQFSWWIYGSSDSNWAGWTMFFFMTIWVREDTHINIHSPAILGIPTGYLVPGFGLPRWGSGKMLYGMILGILLMELLRLFWNPEKPILWESTFAVEVNACQVLLHKLDSSQDNVVQKVDTQKVAVDNLLNSITGAIWSICLRKLFIFVGYS